MSERIAGRKAQAGPRRGRPRRDLAGEVDERILDAARRVFLERGFAGASIDRIAALANAGKPTIYARFADKGALFTEVVMRNLALTASRLDGRVPAGTTLDQRLCSLAATILHWALAGDTISLIRLGVSEARNRPELAIGTHCMARGRAEDGVARLLLDAASAETTQAVFAPTQLAQKASFFMDLVVLPIIMRAVFGEDIERLRGEIGGHVTRAVTFFLAGCGVSTGKPVPAV